MDLAEFEFNRTGHPYYRKGERVVLQFVDGADLWARAASGKYPDRFTPADLVPRNAAARRALTSARAARRAA